MAPCDSYRRGLSVSLDCGIGLHPANHGLGLWMQPPTAQQQQQQQQLPVAFRAAHSFDCHDQQAQAAPSVQPLSRARDRAAAALGVHPLTLAKRSAGQQAEVCVPWLPSAEIGCLSSSDASKLDRHAVFIGVSTEVCGA